MKRLFTFGCSFTQYAWPTWANILGKEYDSFENWGMHGGGNQFIFSSVIECLNKNTLTKDDDLIVMWTDVCRQDGYTNQNWHRFGNFLHQKDYQKFLDIYDFRGLFVRDITLIDSLRRLLESTNCSYQFHSMVPLMNLINTQFLIIDNNQESNDIEDVLKLYKNTIDFIKPSVLEILTNSSDWSTLSSWIDYSYFQKYSIISEIKQIKKKYYALAGPDWPPTFEDYIDDNFKNISRNIEKEISQFDFKKNFFKLKQKKFFSNNQRDYHPSPIEHLRYVESAFKEIKISESTISWVKKAQETIQNGDFFEFDENLPNRI